MTCGLLLAALLGTAVPAAASAAQGLPAVVPVAQTRAFGDSESADPPNADADDPAIWVHPRRPRDSVVVGTLKEGGLVAFDLTGRELQHLAAPLPPTPEAAPGRFNNVDVLGSLAIVGDRGRDRIRVYAIDPRGAAAGSRVLRDVTSPAAPRVFSASEADVDEQRTAYGLAAGTDRETGRPFVVTSRRSATDWRGWHWWGRAPA
jgi:3-phytase